jgi:periplasmic protein TonB
MQSTAPHRPFMKRQATIVVSVIALHVGVLWALQSGLLRQVAEVVAPAEILVEIMAPPAPPAPPTPLAPQAVAQPQPKVQPKTSKPAQPTPTPAAQPTPAPAPVAITPSATTPEPSAAAPTATATAPASANAGSALNVPPAPPAPPKVTLPSTNADYLNNPEPIYSIVSRRSNEQGTVIVSVLVGADGSAKQVLLNKSSGFDRLDRAALDAVLRWRFVPGTRGGAPETMWFNVPIPFQLTK